MAQVTIEKSYSNWGYIDKKGNTVIPFLYKNTGKFSNGLANVCLGFRWGYIDKQGNIAIPFIYEWADAFSNGLAKVKQDGKYFTINQKGEKQ